MPSLPVVAGVVSGAWLCLITLLYLRSAVVTITSTGYVSALPALSTIVCVVVVSLGGAAIGIIRQFDLAYRYIVVMTGLLAATVLVIAFAGKAVAFAFIIWLALISWAVGERLLRCCVGPSAGVSAGQRAVFAIGVGLGLLSHVVLSLGLLGLVGPAVYVSLLTILTIILVPEIRMLGAATFKRRSLDQAVTAMRAEPWLALGLGSLAACWLVIALIEAVAPEIEYDSVFYHLAIPRIWLEQGRISDIPYNSYSYFYLGTETLYLLALGVVGQTAARLVNLMFWLLAIAAVLDVGRRTFNTRSAIYGAILTMATPLLAAQGSSTSVDLSVAVYSFLAAAAAYWWWTSARAGWLVAAGVLCGVALSAKLTALLSIGPLIVMIGVAIALRTRLRVWQDWRPIAVFSAAFIVTAWPWPVLQYAQSGNPTFPFLNAIFQSPMGIGLTGSGPGDYSNNFTVSAMGQDVWGIGTSPGSLVRLPWAITFASPRFMDSSPPAALGLGLVCLPLLIVTGVIRHPAARAGILFALLCGGLWAFTGQAIRYGLALIVPVNLLAGFALASCGRDWAWLHRPALPRIAIGGVVIAWGLASFPLYLSLFCAVPWVVPYAVAFGRQSVDEYVGDSIHTYGAYQFIRADSNGARPRILALTADTGRFYAPGDLITAHYPPVWALLAQRTTEGVLDDLRSLGISYLVVDRTGPHPLNADRLVTQDAFLDSSVELAYADKNVELFRVPEVGATLAPRAIDNILRDSSFEAKENDKKDSRSSQWTLVRGAQIRRSAPVDLPGRGVAWLPHDSGIVQNLDGIEAGQIYALRESLLGGTAGSVARMQITWLDSQKRGFAFTQNVIALTSSWHEVRMLMTTPEGTAGASIYITAQDGEVWVDNVAFGAFR